MGAVAVADADGRPVRSAGDADRAVFARSTMKPLQAAVALSFVDEAIREEERAVMASSHNAEPVHLDAVRAILARAGAQEAALRCPPGLPLDPQRRAPADPAPILHNCSGKHAGMLLACARGGMDPATYPDPGHPLQRRTLEAFAAAAGREPLAIGVDGCGTPVPAFPLLSLATIYARLGAGGPIGGVDVGPVVASMKARPYLVAGRGRVCTVAMDAAPGLLVKSGAEGLLCAALPGGLGVAVKAHDGAARAAEPALIRVLSLLGIVESAEAGPLAPFARRPVRGGGETVGHVVSDFGLSTR